MEHSTSTGTSHHSIDKQASVMIEELPQSSNCHEKLDSPMETRLVRNTITKPPVPTEPWTDEAVQERIAAVEEELKQTMTNGEDLEKLVISPEIHAHVQDLARLRQTQTFYASLLKKDANLDANGEAESDHSAPGPETEGPHETPQSKYSFAKSAGMPSHVRRTYADVART